MSKSFRTRKRGTPAQIGKKFPVLEKKKLPPPISGRYRPVGGILPKLIIEAKTPQIAAFILNKYVDIGPDNFIAPEDYEQARNRVIIKFRTKREAQATIKDMKEMGLLDGTSQRIVY